jgi:putative ABC transport system permease protein
MNPTLYDDPQYVESLLQDIRFGFRILIRSPFLTFAILAALALGVGANTAMFSLVDSVLLHPLRFPDPAALTLVWEVDPQGAISTASAANFLDWREKSHSFAELAGWSQSSYVITGGDRPRQVGGAAVTANFFKALGATPILGRTFLPGEDGLPNPSDASRVALISYSMWQEDLGGDPNVLGRTLILNQVPYAVVGVMGPDFRFLGRRHSVWVPMILNRPNRDFRFITVVGRLNRARSSAVAEMAGLERSLQESYPKTNKGWKIQVDDFREWLSQRSFRSRLFLLAGALALILLIACANVASLLLARSASRARELALRVAVGASPGRIVRQLLIESLMLALTGGGLGLVLAWALIRAAPGLLPTSVLPTGAPLELSPIVLAFTGGISVLTGMFFGLFPAISAGRADVQLALKESSRGSTGGRLRQVFRESLVVMEVAVALVLFSGAGLLLDSVRKLENLDLGIRLDHVLTLPVFLPPAKYDAIHAMEFQRRALERVRALPGVEGATEATNLPLMRLSMDVPFDLETAPPKEMEERPGANYVSIGPDYLKTLGIALKRGRMFTDADNQNSPPVVIVNEEFARRYFPNENPVGKRILLNRPVLGKDSFEGTIHPEIVGLIGNVRLENLNAGPIPLLYAPQLQNLWSPTTWLAVRTTVDPVTLTGAVRSIIGDLDRDLPVEQVRSLEEVYRNQFREPQFQSELMEALALLALLLAVVGIYGINAYTVAQRTREIAIRSALGASSGQIMAAVLSHGLKLAVMGVAIGLGGAFVASRLLATTLVGVSSQNAGMLAGSSAVLLGVSAVACYLPARRAAQIDPAGALRSD